MKKLIAISTFALALSSASVFAQGYIQFANSSTTKVTADASAAAVWGIASGASVPLAGSLSTPLTVGLYYSLDNTTYTKAAETVFSSTFSGRFSGGPTQIPNVAVGATAWYQIQVWETAYGADYNAALNAPLQGGRQAIVGQSSTFQAASGTSFTPGVLTNPGQLSGFQVSVVPEPSTVALGLLGLAGLFIFRRRQ